MIYLIKDRVNQLTRINKSRTMSEAVEELYKDVYRIIQFNLNEVISIEFKGLIDEVLNLKK